jgi:hypothetical protein
VPNWSKCQAGWFRVQLQLPGGFAAHTHLMLQVAYPLLLLRLSSGACLAVA